MRHFTKFFLLALLLLALGSAFDQPAGTKLWEFYTGHPIQSSPAIAADGTVFFGSDNGRLYAFDPLGNGKWEFPTGDAVVASPAIGADGTVYAGSLDGRLYAVTAEGLEKWRFSANGKIISSPALGQSNSVFFGTMAKTLYAVNGEGMKRWELSVEDAIVSSPAVARDGTIYVASLNGVLYAVDFWGKVKWKFKVAAQVNSSPAIGPDGTVYFGSFDGHVYAVRPNGAKKWTAATGAAVRGSAAVGPDGVVYIGSDDRKLYAFVPDGFKLWSYNTGGWVRSTPAISADGTIYVGSYDNSLHAVTKAGVKAWEFATDSAISASPALAPSGVIYFGSWNKRFYAVKGTEGLAANAWSKFRGDTRQTAAVQFEFAPAQFTQPTVRPAFPVEQARPLAVTDQGTAAEAFARAQAARELAMSARKDSTQRTKAAAAGTVLTAKQEAERQAAAQRLASEQAKRDAKAQAASEQQAARDAEASRLAQQKADAEAQKKMLADNQRVLKEAEQARKALEQEDQRRALSAGDLARAARRDAELRAKNAAATELQRTRVAAEQAKADKLAADKHAATQLAEARKAELASIAAQKASAEAERKAREQQTAEEMQRARAAAEQARLSKQESEKRAIAARKASDEAERQAQAQLAAQRKAEAEAERAAVEAERQAKIRQAAEEKERARLAAEAEIAESRRVLEESKRLLKEADATRKQQEAEELQRARAAADYARLNKQEAEKRAAAARKAAEEADRQTKAQQEATRKAEAEAQAAERRRIEAERQKWEPAGAGGFFRRLFGAAPQPATATEPAPTTPAASPVPVPPEVSNSREEAERQARAEAEAQRLREKEQAIARKVAADSQQAAREVAEREARELARQQAAERRRIEAEREKWQPAGGGGFFRRLFGGGSAPETTAKAAKPAQAETAVSVPVPVETAPAAPAVPLRIISDSTELTRPAAGTPVTPAPSFFTPTQPTVDPLADQIEQLKLRAATAATPAPAPAAPAMVQPVAAEEPAQPEKPGFWSRVGSFFIRSRKDQEPQGTQSAGRAAHAPQAVAPWPPANNIVVRDPRSPAGVPGGLTATNFPRVQYGPVTNQSGLFLARSMGQTNIPGMPQLPAPPREVREMRPLKTSPQGLDDMPGPPSIQLMAGRVNAPLRVYSTGPGRVLPELSGAELEVGQTYTLEAQPNPGAIFAGWSGSIETNSPVLRFIMRTGTILVANFRSAANPQPEAPLITLLSPVDGERLASSALRLRGTALGNVGIARIEVSINGSAWQVANGIEQWALEATAQPGTSLLRVRAVDQAGNVSPEITRSAYLQLPSLLTVRVNGAGAVDPDWNGRSLDVGGVYQVRATPAAGHVFAGWSGSVTGSSPLLQFTMQPNLLLEANFTPRVAGLARGVFNGLVYPTNSLVPSKCGFFQIEVGAGGEFTGYLRQGIASHALQGRFDQNGRATVVVLRSGLSTLSLSLQLDTTAGERLMGRFVDDGSTVEMFAYRQVFDGREAVAPLAGRYIFVIPAPTNDVAAPGGDGFGEITVDAAGRVKFAGELPDGTAVRHEAFMGRSGLWPLHVPLAGGRGMLLGWITVTNQSRLDAFGEVIWHKPLSPQDRYYPSGFSTRRHLFGSAYAPVGGATTGGRDTAGMLSGGNLDKIILGAGGALTAASPAFETLQNFRWQLRPETGFVEGTFTHPATRQETAFRGAFLPKVGWTSGYFLGQSRSGVVQLHLRQ